MTGKVRDYPQPLFFCLSLQAVLAICGTLLLTYYRGSWQVLAQKVWFITGTSTGFGKSLVDELIAQNELVVATARNSQKIDQWQGNSNVLIAQYDVETWRQLSASLDYDHEDDWK